MSLVGRTTCFRWLPAAAVAGMSATVLSCASRPARPAGEPGEPVAQVRPVTAPAPAPRRLYSEAPQGPARQSLDTKLPEMNGHDVPLATALEQIREASGLKIEVNWDALKAGGVNQGTTVNFRLTNVRTSKALDIILAAASSGTTRLCYTVGTDRVLVSTRDSYTAYNTEVWEYDIRDLLVPNPPQVPNAVERAQWVKDIIQLICDTVDSDSWVTAGGKPGVIKEADGRLMITQTAENHRQIANLLDQLRETQDHGEQQAPASRPAAPPG